MGKLKITNTLTRQLETFVPLNNGRVKLYVCGVTPYDFAHVGHGRCYVTFDVLYRLVKFLGYEVEYVRNFTDIDDKLIRRAKEKLGDGQRYAEIADTFIKAYNEDMAALNCLKPTQEPRVTENIPEIIDFVQGLVSAGKAYEVDGDVYFDVSSFSEYGKLSGRNVDDLKVGARVEVNEKKRNPLDFALWKAEPEGMFWKTPWGYGRPGWHIECSALSKKYLGDRIDIHAGGMDLIFPHHENEVAQSEAMSGKKFANYWMHNAFVRLNQEKMSKSTGNFFTLRDIFEKFDPILLRFYFLSHSYRAPLDFSLDDLEGMRKAYNKLCRAFEGVKRFDSVQPDTINSKMVQALLEPICDDFNMSGVMGILFENLSEIEKNKAEATAVCNFFNHVLGLPLESIEEPGVEVTPEIQGLIDAREEARAEKDWAKADTIRDQLQELGVNLQDKKITKK